MNLSIVCSGIKQEAVAPLRQCVIEEPCERLFFYSSHLSQGRFAGALKRHFPLLLLSLWLFGKHINWENRFTPGIGGRLEAGRPR